MKPKYRSSIPKTAREWVVDRYADGTKAKAEYQVRGKLVGVRFFHETGEASFETPLKDGVYQGTVYRWDMPGVLLSSEPYRNGLPHGLARQWSEGGELIGSYEMRRGTGIDLWWSSCYGGFGLSEVHYMKDGDRHGFEWWLNGDTTLFEERHCLNGKLHGIEREWNSEGRLRRGYPRYYVHGEWVTKRQYLKACATDPTLPKFREADNKPKRQFPPEVAKHFHGPGEPGVNK